MQTIEINKSAMTWKQFQTDNSTLPLRDVQNAWAELCKERQAAMKARYETALSAIEFKAMGRIALAGRHVGTRKLAAIKRVAASRDEIQSQRERDVEASAKRDAKYLELLRDVAE